MARIKGIDLPNKKVCIALTYIHGIGRPLAKTICENAKVDIEKKSDDLTKDELAAINEEISKILVEGDLRKDVNMNIKRLMEIGSYRGIRHKKGLPVRGQRTITNARTRKGKSKTIANKKK